MPPKMYPKGCVSFQSEKLKYYVGGKSDDRLLRVHELDLFEQIDPAAVMASPARDHVGTGTENAFHYAIKFVTRDGPVRLGFTESPGIPLIASDPKLMYLLDWLQRDIEPFPSDIFRANLARLLRENGLKDIDFAPLVGVSRQSVSQWKLGMSSPSEERLAAICTVLGCTRAMLMTPFLGEDRHLLTPTEWANRESERLGEKIPVQRAHDLVTFGFVEGVQTPHGLMIPSKARAPKDSKSLVLLAKRRPPWVDAFQNNFAALMEGHSKSALAAHMDKSPALISSWAAGRCYPKESELDDIASFLGVPRRSLISGESRFG